MAASASPRAAKLLNKAMLKRGCCVSSPSDSSRVFGLPTAKSLSRSRALRRTALTMASGWPAVRTASSRPAGAYKVYGRSRSLGDACIPGIADDAHHGDAGGDSRSREHLRIVGRLRQIVDLHGPAYRILTRRPKARSALVDERDAHGALDFHLGELASALEGNAEGLRILAADKSDGHLAAVHGRLAGDGKGGAPSYIGQARVAEAGGLDAWQVHHAFQQCAVERVALLPGRVSFGRQSEVDVEDALRLEARIDVQHLDKAAHRQACSGQQDHGE